MISFAKTRDEMEPLLRRWAIAMRRDYGPGVVREAMRRITRQVLAITPPAANGVTGRAAFRQGEAKIERDLRRVFAPVALKGKRRERHPDLEAIYRQRRRFRRGGLGATVGRGMVHFVDERKYKALRKRKVAALGRLASGWVAAAAGLGVGTQRWVSRHGAGRGQFRSRSESNRVGMVASNLAADLPPNVHRELARRITAATRYVERGLEANIRAVGPQAARAVGFRGSRRSAA